MTALQGAVDLEVKKETSVTNYEPSSPGFRSHFSRSSRAQSPPRGAKPSVEECNSKKYRISKNSVRNSFKKPAEPHIDDLYKAKLRLSQRLNVSMLHRGGRAASITNESSRLRLNNKESVASFDPTRTQANPDITHDLAPVRSSPSITTIEEVPTLTNNKHNQLRTSNKRGVSFDPTSSSSNKYPDQQTPVIIRTGLSKESLSKPVLEEAVLEVDTAIP